ncbi:hypothetical protein [Aurantimonas endophytica]|uniref:Uncharacterized protein n=1 Tax=Aurantimonas endophytica TaxID=1522175 RepID=A0A7W6MQE6_9HYPH|nr:hypothetical protein [Aurantimonas endophytica]MBB4003888.1 hypothetical protein [Aurantimonas endophytica]MCO6404739.1 hypothetical protein [Aurantimonas endophytica]
MDAQSSAQSISPDPRATGKDGASSPASPRDFKISDIVVGEIDSSGRLIKEVFAKFSDFAIYSADNRIQVQFSDDAALARQQNEKIGALQPYREKLEYFAEEQGSPAAKYHRQIAVALRLGLLDQTTLAISVLEDAIQKAVEERARNSRISFIPAATLMALPVAGVLLALTTVGNDRDVTFAMAGGALGAYLSMAIGIRTRALSPEVSSIPNYVDSGLRVAIGILSAGALLLLLTSGLVSLAAITGIEPTAPDVPLDWRLAMILGFAAGFLERLLPDLLSKNFPADDLQPQPSDLKAQIATAVAATELKKKQADARNTAANDQGGQILQPG